ncbi:MAG: hypothetical protein ACOY3Y_15005, partial [Acidobacteriota bacterium]
MKRVVLALALVLNLVALGTGCSSDCDKTGSCPSSCAADSGTPDFTEYANRPATPPPELPQGQIWTMIEAQMATMRQSGEQIRENLL